MEDSPFLTIWSAVASGGPIMIALAILSFLLYSNIIGLLLFVTKFDLGAIETREHDQAKQKPQSPNGQEWETALVKYEDVLWQFRQFVQTRHTLNLAGRTNQEDRV